jgi:hypothetical protein
VGIAFEPPHASGTTVIVRAPDLRVKQQVRLAEAFIRSARSFRVAIARWLCGTEFISFEPSNLSWQEPGGPATMPRHTPTLFGQEKLQSARQIR